MGAPRERRRESVARASEASGGGLPAGARAESLFRRGPSPADYASYDRSKEAHGQQTVVRSSELDQFGPTTTGGGELDPLSKRSHPGESGAVPETEPAGRSH